MTSLQSQVALAADTVGLHSSAPALLLELQSKLGALAALATEATDRGRRPFRSVPGWDQALAQLAFGIYNLADQTGTELEGAVQTITTDILGSRSTQPVADA